MKLKDNDMRKRKHRMVCKNKSRHKTKEDVMISARLLKKMSELIVFPYKCVKCGYWHIGKPSFCDNTGVLWQNFDARKNKGEGK